MIKAPIYNSKGNIIGITGIGYDITEHIEGERLFLQSMIERLSPTERLYYFISSRIPESKDRRKEIYKVIDVSEEHGDKIRSEVFRKIGFKEHTSEAKLIMKLYKKYLGTIYDDKD